MQMNYLIKVEEVEQVGKNVTRDIFDVMNDGVFGELAELIGNILDLWPIATTFVLMLVFLLIFKRHSNKQSQALIELMTKNRKYIPGLYVELNDTKELTRYFLFGKKWKRRIIIDYNTLFDDENGRRLREICNEKDVFFHLCKTTSIKRVYESINKTIAFMEKLHNREYAISEEYEKTAWLFVVYGNYYVDKLEKLKTKTEFALNRYIILTGSAGNGKTNLLCSLVELIIDSGKPCVFINSKDVKKDISAYFEERLSFFGKKRFKWQWFIQRLIYMIFCKKIYIVIDAINENESREFVESIPKFINNSLKFRNIKIVISCRSEYFDLKYKKNLVDNVNERAFCYDIMSEEYSEVAKERMFENYKHAFNFSGHVSIMVKEKLYQQLLLMRMFFEVNKDNTTTINSLNKYDIFQKYIDTIMEGKSEECNVFLNSVVHRMCKSCEYTAVKLSEIIAGNELCGVVREFVDETILLSRKLILHPNSIIEKHDEEIYFVFDEMRDYCVAKHVLGNLCAVDMNPAEYKVIDFIDKLVERNATSTEGVINYIYCYYKGEGNNEMCKTIMYKYMQPHDRAIERYRMNRETGINSWGLKVILENDNDLCTYEKEYVRFIMLENPGEELASMFAYLIHQEEIHGKHNLTLFFEILYQIHNESVFRDTLKNTVSIWGGEGIRMSEFIQIDLNLDKKNPEGSKRFREYLFLFLCFLQWNGKEEVQEYLEKVSDIEKIKTDLKGVIYFEEG